MHPGSRSRARHGPRRNHGVDGEARSDGEQRRAAERRRKTAMVRRPWSVVDLDEETQRQQDVPRFHPRRNQGPSTSVAVAPWPQRIGHEVFFPGFRKSRESLGE